MTFPAQISEFALKYFAAESRAAKGVRRGLAFRTVDKKAIARECKVLLESGIADNVAQLAEDLSNFKPGNPPSCHIYRLTAFAEVAGVTYPRSKRPSPTWLHDKPQVKTFDIRKELGASFQKALVSGMTMKTILGHANEVLIEANNEAQAGTVKLGLQALMRNTGLTAGQIADIAQGL